MAHQLIAAGETIGLLGMLDTRARDYIEDRQAESSSNNGHGSQGGAVAGFFRSHLGHGSAKGWWEFFLKDLQERRVRYTITIAARMFSTLPAFLKNTHEINSVAARNYKVKPLSRRLTLFRAANQADSSIPSDNGWSPIFKDGVEIHEVPGDHWQVLSVPGIDVLARSIHGCLSRFDEPTG
jgi:thioesterase domain-containing protein